MSLSHLLADVHLVQNGKVHAARKNVNNTLEEVTNEFKPTKTPYKCEFVK